MLLNLHIYLKVQNTFRINRIYYIIRWHTRADTWIRRNSEATAVCRHPHNTRLPIIDSRLYYSIHHCH